MNDKTPSWHELNQLYAVALERINNLRQSCEDRGTALEAAEAERDAHAQQIATLTREVENYKRFTSASEQEFIRRQADEDKRLLDQWKAAEARATTAERERDELREQLADALNEAAALRTDP